MKQRINIFWFRRDLRLHDNAGLFHALKSDKPIVPVFIFDKNILDELDDRNDRRVEFIYTAIQRLQAKLVKMGSTLDVRFGFPEEIFRELTDDY
ncbi:MAG TPA: deoxyribodipyrimidine photo-lyase, partial [Chitinophagaceae bacterium]|nr:deoxyribodipyrimidine photo-lyase [Chitinophagaceae bacterium]